MTSSMVPPRIKPSLWLVAGQAQRANWLQRLSAS
jgi:hypothetical protein